MNIWESWVKISKFKIRNKAMKLNNEHWSMTEMMKKWLSWVSIFVDFSNTCLKMPLFTYYWLLSFFLILKKISFADLNFIIQIYIINIWKHRNIHSLNYQTEQGFEDFLSFFSRPVYVLQVFYFTAKSWVFLSNLKIFS